MELPVPFTGVVTHGAQAACALSTSGRIGVIGTAATVRSATYGRIIRSIRSDAQVFGKACPLFVPLAENGLFQPDNAIAKLTAQMYLEPLTKENIDTLILGCTHFPLFYDIINACFDYQVTLIDSGRETARYCNGYLAQNHLLKEGDTPPTYQFYVTDDPQGFSNNAAMFLGHSIEGKVEQVSVDCL